MAFPLTPDTIVIAGALAGFCGLLIVAAVSDIATMTIPDWVSVALIALFPVAALLAGLPWTVIVLHLCGAGAIFLAGFAMFALNIAGGGDVKVFTAASLWTGSAALGAFAFATALAGGVLALFILLARNLNKPQDGRPAFINRLLDPARGIPYGVAIACGGCVTLAQQPIASLLRF
jgi:prepilin peptidase CpaA